MSRVTTSTVHVKLWLAMLMEWWHSIRQVVSSVRQVVSPVVFRDALPNPMVEGKTLTIKRARPSQQRGPTDRYRSSEQDNAGRANRTMQVERTPGALQRMLHSVRANRAIHKANRAIHTADRTIISTRQSIYNVLTRRTYEQGDARRNNSRRAIQVKATRRTEQAFPSRRYGQGAPAR